MRKILSLCFSVWWFESGWNGRFATTASMLFSGSLAYALVGRSISTPNRDMSDRERLGARSASKHLLRPSIP